MWLDRGKVRDMTSLSFVSQAYQIVLKELYGSMRHNFAFMVTLPLQCVYIYKGHLDKET